jgi:hypothetical protein
LTRIPQHVQTLSDAFVAELEAILGDRLVGVFQYGAVCFPPSSLTDFDAHVIVRDAFTETDREQIWAMNERLRSHELAHDLDVWYVTLDAMRSNEYPQTELKPGFRDEHWGIHRAHWHAGRFIPVKGPDPRELVPVPTWADLDDGLQSSVEEQREHAGELIAYGALTLCRVLYSYEMRDVVVSKLHAGLWTLAFLDVEHHGVIRAALDAYERKDPAKAIDGKAFYEVMLERIARARELATA